MHREKPKFQLTNGSTGQREKAPAVPPYLTTLYHHKKEED